MAQQQQQQQEDEAEEEAGAGIGVADPEGWDMEVLLGSLVACTTSLI